MRGTVTSPRCANLHTVSVDLSERLRFARLRWTGANRDLRKVLVGTSGTEVFRGRRHSVICEAHMPDDLIPPGVPRPRILISNDDGINAPGLRALVAELHVQEFCDILVCGPAGERSAQSHAITLGKELLCSPIQIQGVEEAFAVDGTPADSCMLAVNAPIFKNSKIDLVVSGINRGDNCGLHVIYSGTVGAAREAACKGLPAIAVSLDDHRAKREEDYAASAKYTVAFMKAVLGLLPGTTNRLSDLIGSVININVPEGTPKGYCMAHQGSACVFPAFREIFVQTTLPDETGSRRFKNTAGDMRWDDTPGSDTWAVSQGWTSVTPLSLRQDILFGDKITGVHDANETLPGVLKGLVEAAAEAIGVKVGGLARL